MFKTCIKVKFICIGVSFFFFPGYLSKPLNLSSQDPQIILMLPACFRLIFPVCKPFSRVSQTITTLALSCYGNTITHTHTHRHTHKHSCIHMYVHTSCTHICTHTCAHQRPCCFPPLGLSLCHLSFQDGLHARIQ